MKRLLCSSLALGLLTWTAHGQQTNTQPAQQNQARPNANVQTPGANVQVQPNANVQTPGANVQVQPNANAQTPGANVQVRPNANVQTPGANVQVQPNTNTQPNANVQTGTGGVTVGAQANTAAGSGTMINGRIVRTGQDQFVVQGIDNKQYTFYTNPQTRYWMNNNPAQYSNLQVGSNVSTWYVPQGERYYVNRVNLLPAGATFPAPEAAVEAAPQQVNPAPGAATNVYQGEIVRVVGQDQVVIRTSDGKEVIVYVNPQTTYRLNEQPATITNLQPGVPVRVDYYMRDNRPYARGILGRRR